MKEIAIYGAGGLGREVALLVAQINKIIPTWKVIGFYDDGMDERKVVDGLPILGGINELNASSASTSIALAVASPLIRREIAEKITNSNLEFPPLIHPCANLGSEQNTFGKGCIITDGCIMTTGVQVDDFVLVNLLCTIGHDVYLGKYSTLMPGCQISGNVRVGEATFLGAGACVLQNISLGAQSTVGAGAVVTKSFQSHSVLIGVPAKDKK